MKRKIMLIIVHPTMQLTLNNEPASVAGEALV